MSWWLATISKHEPRNWELCKEVGLFGYTRGMSKAQPGDHLLVWFGGRGYIGYGVVTDYPRKPVNRREAPWAGGLHRFSSVIPFRMQHELPGQEGVYLKFKENVQERTGFNTAKLQHSFTAVPDEPAEMVAALLLEAEIGSAEDADSDID